MRNPLLASLRAGLRLAQGRVSGRIRFLPDYKSRRLRRVKRRGGLAAGRSGFSGAKRPPGSAVAPAFAFLRYGKPQTPIGPNPQARTGRSARPRSRSTSGGTWSGVSSAGNCAGTEDCGGGCDRIKGLAAACARNAARLSTASTCSPKTCPKFRAAWSAIASKAGSACGFRTFWR